MKWHLKANLRFSVEFQALVTKGSLHNMPLGGQMHIVASTITKSQPTFGVQIPKLLTIYK